MDIILKQIHITPYQNLYQSKATENNIREKLCHKIIEKQ